MLLNIDTANNELFNYFYSGRKLRFDKGEILLRAGETPRGVYLIETGYVKAYSLAKDGTEHTYVMYEPGDIFPVIWIIKDAVRNVYYQATAPATVWIVPKDEFKDFVSKSAQVAMILLEQTTDMFRLYAGRLDNLMYSNSYERTAYRILSVMDRLGRQVGDEWIITAPITHQDIASSVNLTRETVSRCMQRLKRKGYIESTGDRHLVIKDVNGLMKIIGVDEAIGMWPNLAKYNS